MKIAFLSILVSINLLTFLSVSAQESRPIAKKILAFCETNEGKKVGKGECWDLAKEALNQAKAVWTPPYEFGTVLTKKEVLIAGDILQFEKVKIESKTQSNPRCSKNATILAEFGLFEVYLVFSLGTSVIMSKICIFVIGQILKQ